MDIHHCACVDPYYFCLLYTSQSGNAAVSTDGPQPTTTPSVDENGREVIPAYDFTLTDQYGNTHTLSDYKGKIVMLQFFATWCTYCKAELPSVQELYEELPDDQMCIRDRPYFIAK